MIPPDGGPAFPLVGNSGSGLSKRELFAAILGAGYLAGVDGGDSPRQTATAAVMFADALLRELGLS